MAVVTGNTFAIQKKYSAGSMNLITLLINQLNPSVKRVYSVTGGYQVANPLTFSYQFGYSPSSQFEGNYILKEIRNYKNVYEDSIVDFSGQVLYFPASMEYLSQSSKQSVTGLKDPPSQFWS